MEHYEKSEEMKISPTFVTTTFSIMALSLMTFSIPDSA